MTPRWYRSSYINNFYDSSQVAPGDLRINTEYESIYTNHLPPSNKACVVYINFTQDHPIKRVTIARQSTDAVELRIESADGEKNKLTPLMDNLSVLGMPVKIMSGYDCEDTYKVVLYFENPQLFRQLVTKLSDMTPSLASGLLGDDLIKELLLISESVLLPDDEYYQMGENRFKHIIPRQDSYETYGKDSQLADLLKKNADIGELPTKEYGQFISMLQHDANPNQFDLYGEGSAIVYAVVYYADLKILEHLLYYGADPELRLSNGYRYDSAIDLARRLGKYAHLDLIGYAANPIQYPIKLKVKNHNVEFSNGSIKTVVGLYEEDDPSEDVVKVIKTELMHRSTVSFKDLVKLLKMGISTFEPKLNFTKNNLLVEIIRDKLDNIIGFTLFEVIYRGKGHPIYWFCRLSFISEEYRKSGIMSVLSMKNACALQMIYPGEIVGIFYFSIDPNSYRQVKDFKHWPKYQADHLESEVKYLVSKIDSSAKFYHDQLACYVDNRIALKSKKNRQNFYDAYFFKWYLNQPDMNSAGKAVPVLVHVSDDFYMAFKKNCHQLRWDIDDHLDQLVNIFQYFSHYWKLMPEQPTNIATQNCIKSWHPLFFNNKNIPSERIEKKSHLPVKKLSKL